MKIEYTMMWRNAITARPAATTHDSLDESGLMDMIRAQNQDMQIDHIPVELDSVTIDRVEL